MKTGPKHSSVPFSPPPQLSALNERSATDPWAAYGTHGRAKDEPNGLSLFQGQLSPLFGGDPGTEPNGLETQSAVVFCAFAGV